MAGIANIARRLKPLGSRVLVQRMLTEAKSAGGFTHLRLITGFYLRFLRCANLFVCLHTCVDTFVRMCSWHVFVLLVLVEPSARPSTRRPYDP